ncbi:TonB-dependent receptor [Fulvivirgaceae bacterium BMA10]|uniref:TonB-dependent receptor n=1 Tax=Splendidivirga corallicola TaxID=3051826 RepID=A0ABT8KX49_9BACT|nr:TonB-dependent receptor [Fulvivirgaceae bacterium BMA10]
MKIIISLALFLLALACSAQETWRFLDAKSGHDIEGVYVQLQSLQRQTIETLVSDSKGKVKFSNINYPLVVQIQHLSYRPIIDTLTNPATEIRTFQLIPSIKKLDDVVVTGQYGERGIDESIYTVRSINQEKIQAQGAVDLADLLSNNLNIRIEPDKEDGSTGISMLGLDKKYVKVLIDGVPLVGVDGNGNNADLSQINLNNIERVEIVEGPMAVTYGANALAGVVNLITKKPSEKFQLDLSLQEETVGREYGLKEGKHIQTIGIGHRVLDDLSVQLDFRRNDFKGYKGEYLQGWGLHGLESASKRGFEWHPKLQYSGSGLVRYNPGKISMYYRYDFYINQLDRLGNFVYSNVHEATGLPRPYAFDERFKTERHIHNYQIQGDIPNLFHFSSSMAYSNSHRDEKAFRKNLENDTEDVPFESSDSFFKTFQWRGDFNQFTSSDKIDFEVGYDINRSEMQKSFVEGGAKQMTDVGLYGSLEFKPTQELAIRPGFRTSFNNLYDPPIIPSLNIKYEPSQHIDFRLGGGRGYRAPNLIELYDTIPHAGIEITGNPNLRPEDGYHVSFAVAHQYRKGEKLFIESSFSLFYTKVNDQIIMGQVSAVPLKFLYINVNEFEAKGLSFNTRVNTHRVTFSAGLSYIGRLNTLFGIDEQASEFLYYPEIVSSLMYRIPHHQLDIGLFYKYYGKFERYLITTNEHDEDVWRKGKTDPFNWLDLTVAKNFLKNSFKITAGVKNILDINDVASSATTGGAHTAASPTVARSYGRTYFLRLNYVFNR